MRRLGLLAFCASTAFAATPAWACFGPYARQLLEHVPDNAPAGALVMRVDFTNQGEEFRAWQARVPASMTRPGMRGSRLWARRFVGIARRIDGYGEGAFPVYASVTSCTPDFDYGDPPQDLRRQAYLVGRFETVAGERVFIAIARGEREWEPFEAGQPR